MVHYLAKQTHHTHCYTVFDLVFLKRYSLQTSSSTASNAWTYILHYMSIANGYMTDQRGSYVKLSCLYLIDVAT